MGISTNGQLHFGIKFEDGFEFPWDFDDEMKSSWRSDDIEHWWREVNGFINPKFNPLPKQK